MALPVDATAEILASIEALSKRVDQQSNEIRSDFAKGFVDIEAKFAHDSSILRGDVAERLADIDARMGKRLVEEVADVRSDLGKQLVHQCGDVRADLSTQLVQQCADVRSDLRKQLVQQCSDVRADLSKQLVQQCSDVRSDFGKQFAELSAEMGHQSYETRREIRNLSGKTSKDRTAFQHRFDKIDSRLGDYHIKLLDTQTQAARANDRLEEIEDPLEKPFKTRGDENVTPAG